MEDRIYEYEEVGLKEIFGILYKNRYFIITFLVVGLLIGVLLIGLQSRSGPVAYSYQAKATIELVNNQRSTHQDVVVLHVLRSTEMFEGAARDLGLAPNDYSMAISNSVVPNQYDVFVTGPNADNAIRLVNQIVSRTHTITTNAMFMDTNDIVHNGYVPKPPIEASSSVNTTLIVGGTTVFAGILAIFLVFFIRYMDGKVHSEKQVEKLLDTNVIVSIPSDDKSNKIKKFISVR